MEQQEKFDIIDKNQVKKNEIQDSFVFFNQIKIINNYLSPFSYNAQFKIFKCTIFIIFLQIFRKFNI